MDKVQGEPTAKPEREDKGHEQEHPHPDYQSRPMKRDPCLQTVAVGTAVEWPVSAEIAFRTIHWFPQVIEPTRILRMIRHLVTRVAGPREIPIPDPRCQLVAENRNQSRQADVELAPAMVRDIIDGAATSSW
jgi:hypothetical protein